MAHTCKLSTIEFKEKEPTTVIQVAKPKYQNKTKASSSSTTKQKQKTRNRKQKTKSKTIYNELVELEKDKECLVRY